MGESSPEPSPVDPARHASGTGRSALQNAWADYQDHTAGCDRCRTKGGGRCEEAARLWSAHQTLCDQAYAALTAERRARFSP